ncbi:MAG: hypothetical protein CM1200mP29_07760 [Verrucomicrobiota bacterium]|nr:MAG: hypothetical protein CM1200mP29_07760 [Verrucomicrobiota bacterium]
MTSSVRVLPLDRAPMAVSKWARAQGQCDIVAGADRKRGEGGAVTWLEAMSPLATSLTVPSPPRRRDFEIGSIRLGQKRGVSGFR